MANAASPQQIAEQEKRQKSAREIAAADLRWIMSDDRGRRWMASHLDFCGPLRSPFNPNGSLSNFNMGQQNVGLKLFAEIEESCPDLYLIMRQESKRKEESNA